MVESDIRASEPAGANDYEKPCRKFEDLLQKPDIYGIGDLQRDQSSKDPTYELLDHLLSPASPREIELGIYNEPVDLKQKGKLLKFCISPLGGNIVVYVTPSASQQIQSAGYENSKDSTDIKETESEKRLYWASYRKKLNQTEIFMASCTYEIFSTFQEAIKYIDNENPSMNATDDSKCVGQLVGERNSSRILASLLACTSYRTALSRNIFTSSKLAHELGETGLACRVMFLLERVYFRGVLYAETQGNFDRNLWQDLCVWIDLGQLSSDVDTVEQLRKDSSNYNPEVFWPFVYRCLITGKLSLARSILYCHPNYFYVQKSLQDKVSQNYLSPYSFLSIIIKYTPLPDSNSEDSAEIISKWREFLEEHISQELIAGIESYEERLFFLKAVEILRGAENVIMETAHCWREALLGLYLYTYRDTQTFNLHTILDKVRHLSPNTILDAIEMAILSHDLRMAISLCSKAGWWFAPHVMDVIYNSAMFKQSFSFSKKIASKLFINDAITQMRDWYIFHYSELLLNCPSLWHIALEYLSHFTTYGKSFCSSVLRALFIESHVSLKRIQAFCRRHNLDGDAKEVVDIFRSRHRPLSVHKLMNKLQESPTVDNFLSCQSLLKDITPPNSDDHVIQSILDSTIPICHNDIIKQRITMLCLHAMLVLQMHRKDYARAVKSVFRLLEIRFFPLWSSYIIRTDVMKLVYQAPCVFTNTNILEIIRHLNTLPEIS